VRACSAPRRPLPCGVLRPLAVLLAAALSGCAGAPPTGASELRALVTFLRDVHPGPHRYVDAETLDAIVDAEAARLEGDVDVLAMARGVQRVLAAMGDAHLMAGRSADGGEALGFPLLAIRAGDRVFVDASEPPLPIGTELLSVSGLAAQDFLRTLSAYAAVDGGTETVRLAEAERRFADFATLELGHRDAYVVEVRRPDGSPETLSLPALRADARAILYTRRHSAPRWGSAEGAPWPTLLEREGAAILRLPSFGLMDEEGYAARVDALFDALDPEATLALDLRGNEGGVRTHGVAVLRHLLDAPFAQWTRVETRVRAIPRAHASRVSYPFAPADALHDFPGVHVGDRWVFEGEPLAEQMIPTGEPHAGEVFVFIDDATNSAAIELVAALLAHREGVRVIGTETQGECGRHTGHMPVLYEVGAGVVVLASLFEITLVPIPGCAPGRGVVPDIPIVYEEAHFLEGRDPFVEALDGE
jgi:C-terminal processing protease CtpA/Prc